MRLVTRESWGAAPPKSVTPLDPRRIDTIFTHYTAADADEQSDHAFCAKRVRGIQRFHQETRGWNDIAYSFVFCKHGYIFEGRGWDVYTAATGNDNNHSLAFCFLGDDSINRDDVGELGREGLIDLHRAAWARYGSLKFKGHRDAMQTTCPGDQLWQFVHSRDFKKLVEGRKIDKGYWQWLAWTLGEGDYKGRGPYSKPRPGVNVFPRKIPASWHVRRFAYIQARKR